LADLIEDARKEMPYFFSKAGPKIKDTTPNGSGSGIESGDVDFSKMSLDEMRSFARKIDGAKA
jgi:hypothetical protein